MNIDLALAIGFYPDGTVCDSDRRRLENIRNQYTDDLLRELASRVRAYTPQPAYFQSDVTATTYLDQSGKLSGIVAMGILGDLCVAKTIAHALFLGINVLVPTATVIMSHDDMSLQDAVRKYRDQYYHQTNYSYNTSEKGDIFHSLKP